MSKDYKATPPKAAPSKAAPAAKQKPEGKGSPLMIGLLIGLLVGIGLSLAVAFSVKSGGSAFQEKETSETKSSDSKKPATKETPPSTVNAPVITPNAETNSGQISSEHETAGKKAAEADKKEDRFTFYGILTETNQPTPSPEAKPANPAAAADPQSMGTPKPSGERYYLQVGAFSTEHEADNTKARLSLLGLDAVVQTATIPDKGVLHRVRVGPLTGNDELARAKAELARNGFKAEPVKISN